MPFLVATSSTLACSQRRSASTGAASRGKLLGEIDELVDLVAVDGLEQRLARREMAIERADADPGRAGHRLEAGVRAAGAEHVARRLQQRSRLRSESARGLRLAFSGVCPIFPVIRLFACKTEASSV